jgi:GT2 family glycosyltransferase
VRCALLDEIGFFDPELGVGTPTGAGEDVDLIYRFIAAGCQVHYVPEVVVDHNHGRRTRAQVRRVKRAYSHGLGAFYAKYFLASDRRVMKWAYWDIRDTLRSHALRALFLAKSREEILHLFQVLIGMSIYRRHRAHSRSPQG